jgi:hypothetical protein
MGVKEKRKQKQKLAFWNDSIFNRKRKQALR